MTSTSRSGLAALGAIALVSVSAGDASAANPKAPAAKKPVATQGKKPAAAPARPVATQTKATKIRYRDRGSFNKPHPQSAWYALGMNKRFLKAGDAWQMAWTAMTRPEIRKMAPSQVHASLAWGTPYYVNYVVKRVWQHRLGAGVRTLATIRISYAKAPLTAHSRAAEVTVDQYWNPVSFRVFSSRSPYGTRQDKDTRRVLHGVGEFPLYVGDLENVPGRAVAPPRLAAPLAKLRMPTGAKLAVKVNNGANVHAFTYWTPGFPYASVVVSQHHQGVLVSQKLAR